MLLLTSLSEQHFSRFLPVVSSPTHSLSQHGIRFPPLQTSCTNVLMESATDLMVFAVNTGALLKKFAKPWLVPSF